MKRALRRWWLKRRLARTAEALDSIASEREMLVHTERYFIRQSNDLRLQLLNLDIRSRHA